MTRLLPTISIPLRTPSRINANRIYWADLLQGRKQVKTIRVHTGVPKLWLCTDVHTLAETAIPEAALETPQP